ncbi:hypothetical protein BDDG_09375 [Blastomyces dermatitidis ATCC 18188]|uniref:Uncharacterized protein n=1 Tax=Ajellomyces dermatitidis (strain ATCC 18188 / CBS 674.68) TaxID=653446 RepID=F2TT67_AJEDA|nr:hypothetical protein BDDG_09375 [Blastomyces dermatitidis ATCC 18188]
MYKILSFFSCLTQHRQVVISARDYIRAFSQREDEETVRFCRFNSAAAQAELRHAVEEKLQIELLEVTVLRIKLSSDFSPNDHTGSYTTVLTEREGGITIAVREVRDRSDTDKLTGRRNDTSLQGMITTTTAAKEAGEEGDMTIRAVLSQLIDTAAFNLAFLTVMKTASAS